MAGPNEIMRGGLNGILSKTLSMKEGAPAAILGAEIIPILELESQRPEWEFLSGSVLWGAAQTETAVAGNQNCVVQVRNPANSGVICIIERAVGSLQAVAAFQGGNFFTHLAPNLTQAVYANTVQKVQCDSRANTIPTAPIPILLTSDRVAAQPAGGNIVSQILTSSAANGQGILADLLAGCGPLIIAPGTQVHLTAIVAVGSACSFTVGGRVRSIEPSETR